MLELWIFVGLVVVGFASGYLLEQRHYRAIIKRENAFRSLPVIASKKVPDQFLPCRVLLVNGNVVISVDYFKRLVAGLRGLVGGHIRAYESLLDRARREAVLRMQERAKQQGANYIFNVKIETASISL